MVLNSLNSKYWIVWNTLGQHSQRVSAYRAALSITHSWRIFKCLIFYKYKGCKAKMQTKLRKQQKCPGPLSTALSWASIWRAPLLRASESEAAIRRLSFRSTRRHPASTLWHANIHCNSMIVYALHKKWRNRTLSLSLSLPTAITFALSIVNKLRLCEQMGGLTERERIQRASVEEENPKILAGW